jgi:hypothetical protein
MLSNMRGNIVFLLMKMEAQFFRGRKGHPFYDPEKL